ncbi:MAG: formylglycine-generating enzyme family protein [Chitinophagaceae bacterium]
MIKFISLKLLLICVIHSVLSQQPTLTNTLGMEFVLIKPGSMMVGKYQPTIGKPDGVPPAIYQKAAEMALKDVKPGFTAVIDKPYYMGKYEVTQDQWKKLTGKNPAVFINDSSGNHPVENISWNDALDFVQKLSAFDKKHIYRLPTEFEWEYAARAGEEEDISWSAIREAAVLSGSIPSAIGMKKPNAWGLYDMLGNVWEWVQDYYNEKIFADPVPPGLGKHHVLKGASFTGDVKNATYMTHAAGPGNGFDTGLRVVMEVRQMESNLKD